MRRVILSATLVAVLTLAVFSSQSQPAEAQQKDFQLTVRNITARQPISPPIVVVHNSNAVILPRTTAERLPGLETFAESGSQPELMESLRGRTGVKNVLRFGGVLAPNSQQTLLRVPAEPGDHVSVLGMLQCTNDAITLGTVIVSDDGSPAFGSGAVWDAGTENNDESRSTVPCLDGEGASYLNSADGEGRIKRHPGISGDVDLGGIFAWDRTVTEIVLDARGARPSRAFEVGATLENRSTGQPITPPVVVVHDKNVDVIEYTRPRELTGIDKLSESGEGAQLLETLSEVPGVVSVRQWWTDGPIAPGGSFSGNARAFVGNKVTVLGMFACTNDGYIVASAEVEGSSVNVARTSSVAMVFDSGAENNDETTDTVPCLGGEAAALSEGNGENGRRIHPGISGDGDLVPATHGWTEDKTAVLTLHAAVEEAPRPDPVETPEPAETPEPGETPKPEKTPEDPIKDPETGGFAFASSWVYAAMLGGVMLMLAGGWIARSAIRRREAVRIK